MRRNKTELTKKEIKLYYKIKDYIEKYNYSPSYRELTDFNIFKSLATIMDKLLKLEDLGYITLGKDKEGKIKSRTIRIIYTSEIRDKLEKMEQDFEIL